MDYTVHEILQARILEWVAFPFSRGIQYLISEASSFVTGTVAIVDGGFNAYAM